MEKKLIVLVLIALIAGLGGGYGLGYVIYQPQIQNLQEDLNNLNDKLDTINSTLRNTQSSVMSLQNELSTLNSEVTSLNSTVETMENRTWHEAYHIDATSDVRTDTFLIKGKWVRIRWYMLGEYSSSWIDIWIYYSNGTLYADRGSSGIFSSYACDLAIVEPNTEYYLEIETYEVTEYSITIWEYY